VTSAIFFYVEILKTDVNFLQPWVIYHIYTTHFDSNTQAWRRKASCVCHEKPQKHIILKSPLINYYKQRKNY
jgi:hypothetical protein